MNNIFQQIINLWSKMRVEYRVAFIATTVFWAMYVACVLLPVIVSIPICVSAAIFGLAFWCVILE